ncbi:hypothetical protein GCM10010339_69550 [Streptomyces alanosinicus]|uniref:Uncharacterized protein n=1 Tax=Streptomyces alanosinicus TaxID=68171 RepID=A0A918YRI3_9ACTN|nr:hypothetical protein GCM10010339_69550 [Streptomyces alanosinicus]
MVAVRAQVDVQVKVFGQLPLGVPGLRANRRLRHAEDVGGSLAGVAEDVAQHHHVELPLGQAGDGRVQAQGALHVGELVTYGLQGCTVDPGERRGLHGRGSTALQVELEGDPLTQQRPRVRLVVGVLHHVRPLQRQRHERGVHELAGETAVTELDVGVFEVGPVVEAVKRPEGVGQLGGHRTHDTLGLLAGHRQPPLLVVALRGAGRQAGGTLLGERLGSDAHSGTEQTPHERPRTWAEHTQRRDPREGQRKIGYVIHGYAVLVLSGRCAVSPCRGTGEPCAPGNQQTDRGRDSCNGRPRNLPDSQLAVTHSEFTQCRTPHLERRTRCHAEQRKDHSRQPRGVPSRRRHTRLAQGRPVMQITTMSAGGGGPWGGG